MPRYLPWHVAIFIFVLLSFVFRTMISFEEAFEIVMKSAFETETEIIPFSDSDGRILAEDIYSDIDICLRLTGQQSMVMHVTGLI